MSEQTSYSGSCFCGEVELEVIGEPAGMGYCHCASCRHWSAGPVNAFTLWTPEQVKITRGAEHLASYNKSPRSIRKWCTRCGGHVLIEHPEVGLTDVFHAIIPDLPFKPGVHVHYQDAALRIHDGITKLKDLPGELGGSGEILPE